MKSTATRLLLDPTATGQRHFQVSLDRVLRFAVLAVATLGFLGCQTPRQKLFESVQVGMAKDQVLASAGGPNRTKRWKDKDRWTYVFWDEAEGRKIKEVHFSEGIATYVGPEVGPKVSAETQDAINLGSDYQPQFEEITPSKVEPTQN